MVGLNSNCGGLLSDSSLQLADTSWGYVGVGADSDSRGRGLLVLAFADRAVSSNVWVDRFKLSLIASLVVLVGSLLSAAVAAIVTVGVASEQLLLREAKKLTLGDEVGAFKRASGREGPARAAASLVHHFRDSTGSDPVDLIRVGRLVKVERSLAVASRLIAKNSLVLSLEPVTELVVSDVVVRLRVGVMLLDERVSRGEVLHTHIELLNVVVHFVELGEVIHVFVL